AVRLGRQALRRQRPARDRAHRDGRRRTPGRRRGEGGGRARRRGVGGDGGGVRDAAAGDPNGCRRRGAAAGADRDGHRVGRCGARVSEGSGMSEKREGLFSRAEEVIGLFRKGAEFTQELLRENERLRRELARVEGQQLAASDEHAWEKLRGELLARIESLEGERTDMLERLHQVEDENRHFTERYIEIEEENNNLASLYVASFQLHSTLHLPEVLQIIVEIVINLIGAEVFAIYVLDEKTNVLSPVASEGAGPGAFPAC